MGKHSSREKDAMDIEQYAEYIHFYTDETSELLLKYLNQAEWKSFLDMGCGDGALLSVLNKRGYFKNKKVYAVDLSQNRINIVKRINKDFNCQVGSACDLNGIEDSSIDFLVSTQVIEHVPDDRAMVEEIRRVVKQNGTVYLTTVFKKWYGWYFYRCNGKWTIDPTHLREYTRDSQILDIIHRNDLEVLENKKTLFWFPVIDFIFRRMSVGRNIFNNMVLTTIRKIKIPILGYYNWELVLQKKTGKA